MRQQLRKMSPDCGEIIYINGACGDVNPKNHRGGQAAANFMGRAIAAAVQATLKAESMGYVSNRVHAHSDSVDRLLVNKLTVLKLPRAPLPSVESAQEFLDQQKQWLQQERDTQTDDQTETCLGADCALACCKYAEGVLTLASNASRVHNDESVSASDRLAIEEAKTINFRVSILYDIIENSALVFICNANDAVGTCVCRLRRIVRCAGGGNIFRVCSHLEGYRLSCWHSW